ncbi:unnamed protein product [Rotaria sp. Silwood1]|nr:unnamed protein product [Rotaria sp. Silwood1]
MHLLVFFLLLISCACDIKVSIDRIKGQYNISIDNQIWFRSSHTALYANDHWYLSNDSSLPLIDTNFAQGNDPNLAITFHLNIGDKILMNNKLLDKNQVRTIFPSFNIEQIHRNDNRGYFTFQGVMMGFTSQHAGIWNSFSQIIRNSLEGGPVILCDLNKKGHGNVVIISPFSQFTATSWKSTR